jgi:hypothetical protein
MFAELGTMSLVVLLLTGCTAPRPNDEESPAEAARIEPTLARPPVEPSQPVEQPALDNPIVDPNAPCPRLRVFKDLDDLCDRGLMPLRPIGWCERAQAVDTSEEDAYGFPIVKVAALGGVAELVEREYADAGGTSSVTTYLVVRRKQGYVLLAEVAQFDGELGYPAVGENFEGTATTLELRTTQEFLEPYKLVATTLSCSINENGEIRCGGTCPTLAIEEASQPLDCAAIETFDWAGLPPGEDATALPRDVYIGHPRPLTIMKPKSNEWVLFHGEVPLVTSDGEIRVGQGPGGIFVISYAAKLRRIHRLHLSTHELEPVTPGPCGAAP